MKNLTIYIISILYFSSILNAQFNISGLVKGEDNLPLSGANVFLGGTSYGSATDDEGKFNISNVNVGQYKLVASYLGYTTSEIMVEVIEI